MKPKPGEVYRKRGFTLTVHAVDDDSVWVLREKDGQSDGRRVSLETWNRQIRGAEKLK